MSYTMVKRSRKPIGIPDAGISYPLLFEEQEKLITDLIHANKKIASKDRERAERAVELVIANEELLFQTAEKGKRAAELIIANEELEFQTAEKGKRAAELVIANEELEFQTAEKGKRAAELILANVELLFQTEEKGKRAAELVIANQKLTPKIAETLVREKKADLVSFGMLYISDPDLVDRILAGGPFNETNASTIYAKGATGYSDYPFLPKQPTIKS